MKKKLQSYLQQHNKVSHLYIQQLQPLTIKITLSFNKQNNNEHSHTDHQIFRPITKSPPTIKLSKNTNSFTNHNYDFFTNNNINNATIQPLVTTQNQSQEHKYIHLTIEENFGQNSVKVILFST